MDKKYFIIFICSIIFITIISITIAVFSNSNGDKINEKIEQELDYIEAKLLGMINSLNNISFSNSVLLEQFSGQNQKSTQQTELSEGQNGGQQALTLNENEQNKKGSSQESQSEGEKKDSDFTKYNIENKNILLQDETEIDWNYLKNTVEVIFSSWPTSMIDLNSIGVQNENIIGFSNTLDNLVVSVENEDKRETLNNLAILYSLLPIFVENNSNGDIEKINIAYTKSFIINSYVLLEDKKWDEMQNEINKADSYFQTLMNNVNIDIQHQNVINKTYVAINEMNNAINLKDKKLFYLKYINVMECAMKI